MAADSAEGHEAWGEAVVIDLGSAFCRAGLVQSGSDEPMARFESIVGTPKTPPIMVGMPQPVYVGERALGRCGVLILQKPVVRGLVADWQAVERVWHHIYFNELRVVPEEHPVLLTEAPLTPKADREKVTQIMFETFGVQALYVAVQAVLTLYDSGRATGTVVDLGEGVTRVVPVCDGFAMPHAVAQLHVAGQHFTDYLALLLKERDGIEFSGRAEREILREIKETLGFVALDEASCQSASDEAYEQPDGVLVNVSSERCRCFEVLWRPGLLGSEVTPHRVAKRLAALSTHRAPEMEGQHLANVSWSLGTWRLDSPRWFQALCEELSRREVRTLEPRHVANILWAMARVGVRSAVLQQLGTDLSKGGLEKFQARDLAASVWAFASLEVLHGDFFRAVAKSSGEKLRSFSDQDLQNLAWAFALAARFGLSCELAALDAYRFNRRDQLERFVDFRVAGPGHFPESFGGRVRAVSGGLAEVAVAVAEEERGARTGETVVLVNEALFALLSSAEVVQPLELDDGGEMWRDGQDAMSKLRMNLKTMLRLCLLGLVVASAHEEDAGGELRVETFQWHGGKRVSKTLQVIKQEEDHEDHVSKLKVLEPACALEFQRANKRFFVSLALAAARDLDAFDRLQVSAPMTVDVVTDAATQANVDVAADGLNLGWTVQSTVTPMTFGRTLLLGMDDRARRQGFHWPEAASSARLVVPVTLAEVAVTGGAKVVVDNVTDALLADKGSSLTVKNFTGDPNRTNIFIAATGANITILAGHVGKAFVQVGKGSSVVLNCDINATIEAHPEALVFVNSTLIFGNLTAGNLSNMSNLTAGNVSNMSTGLTTKETEKAKRAEKEEAEASAESALYP
ncbi:unnamed protein product [Effrenium voratum]|nr:unnamed protein product [Effrenium voratum]